MKTIALDSRVFNTFIHQYFIVCSAVQKKWLNRNRDAKCKKQVQQATFTRVLDTNRYKYTIKQLIANLHYP